MTRQVLPPPIGHPPAQHTTPQMSPPVPPRNSLPNRRVRQRSTPSPTQRHSDRSSVSPNWKAKSAQHPHSATTGRSPPRPRRADHRGQPGYRPNNTAGSASGQGVNVQFCSPWGTSCIGSTPDDRRNRCSSRCPIGRHHACSPPHRFQPAAYHR